MVGYVAFLCTPSLWFTYIPFGAQVPLVNLAHDCFGRDMFIKAVTSSSSMEWDILRYLNSPPCRSDRRNRTIPVLDVLYVGEWILVIQPA